MSTKSVKQNDKEIETFITRLTADLRFSVWPVSKSGKSFSLISRTPLDSPSFKYPYEKFTYDFTYETRISYMK